MKRYHFLCYIHRLHSRNTTKPLFQFKVPVFTALNLSMKWKSFCNLFRCLRLSNHPPVLWSIWNIVSYAWDTDMLYRTSIAMSMNSNRENIWNLCFEIFRYYSFYIHPTRYPQKFYLTKASNVAVVVVGKRLFRFFSSSLL